MSRFPSLKNIFFKKQESVEKVIINIPQNLLTNDEGFGFFADLHKSTKEKKNYVLDFEEVLKIETNLYAVLGAIIKENTDKGASFSYDNLNSPYVKESLISNGLVESEDDFEFKTYEIEKSVPYHEFSMIDESVVEDYIYKYVLTSNRMPKISEMAKRKIFRSIFEVYQNSVMHTGADRVFVCGQYYEHKQRLELTMVDMGITFRQKVRGHNDKYKEYSGEECIKWAVESGNTTKPDNETGGLGLDLIREFLRLNNGKIQIRSADGYWEERKETIFTKTCDNDFQGSIVNMEFNLYDEKTYYIRGEYQDIKDIL